MEKLTWLLDLDAKTDGATEFSKKLKEVEDRLGAADVATSKTERKLESTGHTASKMAAEVAAASQKYVASLMQAGVPLEKLDRLGKTLQRGLGKTDAGPAAKGPEDEVKKLRGTLDALKRPGEIERLKKEISEFGKPVKEAREGFKGVGQSIEEAKHSAHGFLETVGALVAFEGIKFGIEKIHELGSEILNVAAAEERQSKVFELNLGVKGGEEAQEYAAKYARNTEFSVGKTEEFASSLLQAGVTLEKLDIYMAAAGDVAARSTDSLEGMTAAVAALSRATQTGKLEGRALRGLHLGIPQMRELDEFRKKSGDELKAILEDGELTTEQVMRMIAGRDGKVGDQAVAMGKTMSATLTHIAELPEEYFKRFANTPAFETMKGKLSGILESLSPEGPQGSRIFAALDGAVTGIVGAVAEIDLAKVVDQALDIGKTVASIDWKGGAESMLGLLQASLQVVRGIGVAFDAVSGAITSLTGNGEDVVKRKAVQASAERDIPSDVRRAVVKEIGELPATPENAAIARRDADTARSQRENRNRLRHLANHLPFVDLADEAPSAAEVFQEHMAAAMQRSEAAGPQLPRDRVQTPIRKATEGAEYLTPYFESAGQDAVSGYGRGLMSGAEVASRAGMGLAESALSGTAKAQDSHSPSRKFARLGGYAADGYVDGIDDGAEEVARAGAGLGKAALGGVSPEALAPRFADSSPAVPLFSPAAAAIAPAATSTTAAPVERKIEINVTVPISMPAGARTREVDDMIAKLKAMLPGTLQAAVEALAIEGGV